MRGINPQVLRWARERTGLSIEEVAGHFKKSPESIQSWETGSSSPSFPQLEQLAKKYKRPTALFFFSEVPQEESLTGSFRTLPQQEINHIKPHLRFVIRKARVMQINLSELNHGNNPSTRFLLDNFEIEGKDIATATREIRNYLGVDLNTQQQYSKPEIAFKQWRSIIEQHGVFVFKDAFRDEGFSGFCLYDDVFPIIYINNSLPYSRQIFTLFHELAHLLFSVNGIEMSSQNREYLNRLSGDDRKIEVFCNAFAGKFLVPDDDFIQYLNAGISDNTLQHLAKQYVVSREVILRKFLDNRVIDSEFYNEKVKQWKEEWEQRQHNKSKPSGGNPNFTKRAYLGESYMEMAFSQYYKNNISTEQLADYLDVKIGRLAKMESLIFEERSRA